MITTNVKVIGSTNGISNKYSINSYYSIGNHTHDYISYLIRIMLIIVNVVRHS